MLYRITVIIAVATAFSLVACDSKQETAKSSTEAKSTPEAAPKPKATPKPADTPAAKTEATEGEVVFDPRKPPAGYSKCHRNHCHKVGGGVASYKQVMAEIGATKIIGVPKQGPMPPAPPDVAAAPADAEKTPSGLASRILSPGTSSHRPMPTSVVTVHYSGWTTDGKGFDSSVSRGRPATFPLNRVIPGWTEGLQLMNVGEERRLWIPEDLAYGGRPGKPAGMLVFDVELLSIR